LPIKTAAEHSDFLPFPVGGGKGQNLQKKGAAGWKDYFKRYPKSSGYWSFSPVGYDTKGSEALVYVGHHCGGRCGTGQLELLAKENGHWIVKNRVMLWIS
jgi:hypothetical protein